MEEELHLAVQCQLHVVYLNFSHRVSDHFSNLENIDSCQIPNF